MYIYDLHDDLRLYIMWDRASSIENEFITSHFTLQFQFFCFVSDRVITKAFKYMKRLNFFTFFKRIWFLIGWILEGVIVLELHYNWNIFCQSCECLYGLGVVEKICFVDTKLSGSWENYFLSLLAVAWCIWCF